MEPARKIPELDSEFWKSATTAEAKLKYYPRDEVWSFASARSTKRFDFHDLLSYATPELVLCLKAVLVNRLRHGAIGSAHASFVLFKRFAKHVFTVRGQVLSEIAEGDFDLFKTSLQDNEAPISLHSLFRKWWVYPGISDGLRARQRFRARPQGRAVLQHDPESGYFTAAEIQLILTAIYEGFSNPNPVIALHDFLLVLLLIALGTRPVQLAGVKIKDFKMQPAGESGELHLLHLPMGKQRNSMLRDKLKWKQLHDRIGLVMKRQISMVQQKYADLFPHGKLPMGELPLFPSWSRTNLESGFEYHTTGKFLTCKVERIFSRLDVWSPRTGERLHVNARRFRHSLATHAAIQGYGVKVIAEWLDQVQLTSAWMYVRAVPKLRRHISKALNPKMARYAAAYKGEIIPDESVAPRFNSKTIRVSDEDTGTCYGNCAKSGICEWPLVACFVCKSHVAWRDALPRYKEYLESLLRRRDEYLATDPRNPLATVYDENIAALQDLIGQIEALDAKDAAQ